MSDLDQKIIEVTRMRDVQGSSLAVAKDPYMLGIYNGLELACSMLQNREPEFKKLPDKNDILAGRPEGARSHR